MAKDGLYRRSNGSWIWDVVIGGQRYVRSFDRSLSLEEAKDLAAIERREIILGNAGIKKPKKLLFETAVDLFLEYSRTNHKPSTVRYHQQTTETLLKEFRGKGLSEITTFSVETCKKRRAIKAKVRVNREVAVLKAIFNRMIEWKKFPGPNPCLSVKRLPEAQTKLRFLDHEEEARLLSSCKEPLRTILIAGIHCGLRIQAEALTLKWSSVDLNRRTLTVEWGNAKSHKERKIPLNETAFQALQALSDRTLHGSEDYVFINRRGQPFKSIRGIFERACKKAKIAGVDRHTTRHTFATRLVEAGVDLRTIQELGGWSTLELVARYSHVTDERKRAAVERLDAVVRIVGTQQGNGGESRGIRGNRSSR